MGELMEDTKAIEFFQGVLSKTRAGRIRWQPTAEDTTFIAALGGQFTLSVWEYENRDADIFPFTRYALTVKDRDCRVLTTLTSSESGIVEDDVRELYETVRRQALKVDDKIDQVLVELSKL
jgi:hypothetical protein